MCYIGNYARPRWFTHTNWIYSESALPHEKVQLTPTTVGSLFQKIIIKHYKTCVISAIMPDLYSLHTQTLYIPN